MKSVYFVYFLCLNLQQLETTLALHMVRNLLSMLCFLGFLPFLSFSQTATLSIEGHHYCSPQQYTASLRVKAEDLNDFVPGHTSLFLSYDRYAIEFNSYSSAGFDPNLECSLAWDVHNYDQNVENGQFSLVLTQLEANSNCLNVNQDEWIDIGVIVFNVMDENLNPKLNFDVSKTLMNQSVPNDGTNPVIMGSLNGIDQGSGIGPCNVFPVEWLDFKAENVRNEVALEWTVAREVNNYQFVIERSTDGVIFSPIAQVKSLGNTESPRVYKGVDPFPHDAYSYYRIKQVDFDGSFSFSTTVEVNVDESGVYVHQFPNPMMANDDLNISLSLATQENVKLGLYSINGHQLHEEEREFPLGRSVFSMHPPSLAPGMYYIKASGNDWSRVLEVSVR